MASERKKAKRAAQKLRKREKLREKAAVSGEKLDVLQLFRETKLETKPEIAEFLEKHVLSVKVFVKEGFWKCWPADERVVSKVFVKMLDGQELVWLKLSDGKIVPRVALLVGWNEDADLSAADISLLEEFF